VGVKKVIDRVSFPRTCPVTVIKLKAMGQIRNELMKSRKLLPAYMPTAGTVETEQNKVADGS
jgi:hypothetical protein